MFDAISSTVGLSCRARAILRAVAAGRAELVQSCEPDLFIDGLCCTDQCLAHQLVRDALIAAATPAAVGRRVAARLTPAGAHALAEMPAAA